MEQKTHYERMMEIIEESFHTRNDPDQLQVNAEAIEKLERLHPATLSEYNDGRGPAAWVLLIPTTETVMRAFVESKINEQQVLDQTFPGIKYESIYLCSATVLPEYRKKGIARDLCLQAIDKIRAEHPVHSLFVWAFSEGGARLAERVARETGLPLFKKSNA